MDRDIPPPEQADSWGEFHARLEYEMAARANTWSPLLSGLAGLLFASGLIACAYATQDHKWWLWLCMLAPLAAVGGMAIRALDRADSNRERAAELVRLNEAWEDHLNHRSPTL